MLCCAATRGARRSSPAPTPPFPKNWPAPCRGRAAYLLYYPARWTSWPRAASQSAVATRPKRGRFSLAQLALALTGAPHPHRRFERGADRELTLGAVAAGGQALAILPLGLSQAGAILSLAGSALDTGRLLLLSPFAPDTPYSERTAQARLPLVAALAHGLLLVEPDRPLRVPGVRDCGAWRARGGRFATRSVPCRAGPPSAPAGG